MKNLKIRTLFILILLLVAWSATQPQVKAFVWSPDMPFTTASSFDYAPVMIQTPNKRIWMFWHSKPIMETSSIFYNYTDDGITWSRGFRLTTSSGNDADPSAVATRDGKIWVFWVSDRDGNFEIYYKNSANNGASWSADYRLTFSSDIDKRPSAMQASDGKIWLVWYNNRTGNNDLWYKTYDGTQWSQDNQLTNNLYSDIEPCIMQDISGKIWVFWSAEITEDNYELFNKTSVDNGANWSNENQRTDYPQQWDWWPSAIQAQDGKIWVVWMRGGRTQNFDIYYMTFDGTSWSDDDLIVSGNAQDRLPAIFQSADATIWIAWTSDHERFDYDICYKMSLDLHDVAIADVKASKSVAYQVQKVSIEVVAKNHGANTETFEVKCYVDSILIGSKMVTLDSLQKSSIVFLWDTSTAATGTYRISATASIVVGETNTADNTYTDGTVQVKLPGDVNSDGTVNVYDAVLMIRDIDATPNSPNWNGGRSDINDDGRVSGADVTILATNYGRTSSL